MTSINATSFFSKSMFALVAMLIVATGIGQAAQIYDGANGAFNADSWNISARWNSGAGPVPSGTDDVEIASGRIPWAVNSTGSYSGDLTLKTNSILGIGPTVGNNTVNALGTSVNTRTITMESGSRVTMRYGGAYTFNQLINLTGPATLRMAESTSGHHQTRTFSSAISGAELTIIGGNNNLVNLNAGNTFSGLILNADDRYRVSANAPGALGLGDVTINKRSSDTRSAVLIVNASDVFDEFATLYINDGANGWNDGGSLSFPLVMNFDATIGDLWVNGSNLGAGVYDNSESWLNGNGVLTVTGITSAPVIPEPSAFALLGLAGLFLAGVAVRRSRRQ